jgi:YVTN family beta-propeller protein
VFGGVLVAALSIPALAQSVPFPTYQVGPQADGTYIVSDGTVINPAGTQVNLGVRIRAKAIALNPNTATHTAAVLTMGASTSVYNGLTNGAVEVISTSGATLGTVVQTYNFNSKDAHGSSQGIAYTPDGLHLLFSQDDSYVTIANVDPTTGLLTDNAQVSVPVNGTLFTVPGVGSTNILNPSSATCFPSSPEGTTGSFGLPCGWTYSAGTSYPTGLALAPNGKTAYSVLDVNNQLAMIDLTPLTATPPTAPVQGAAIRVGNIPHSVVVSADGYTAYVSNEAGRIATARDFQMYSDGTPVVAQFPTGATDVGTISIVNLTTFKVTGSITVGHHPTGMAFYGNQLLVANTYDDTISVIDTTRKMVTRTINLGLPLGPSGKWGGPGSTYGAGPNSIAVDAKNNLAYVALYNANSVAVVDLNQSDPNPVLGMIPVGYAPSSVVIDAADSALLVANDKGWGTTGYPNPFIGTVAGATTTDNSTTTYQGSPQGLNTHQDLGTVSIVPLPIAAATLVQMTDQVFQNNHWDLTENIFSASGGSKFAKPAAIPEKIGSPSLIKHVFLIIRENRTYDQVLGDVAAGNGDPALAIFGASVTPNAHALVQRFPLLDNFYDPSRQSADGHNWIMQAMAPYSDDIQSPDWVRDYPSNGGDALAYQNKGHLFDLAAAAGLNMKIFGEYVEYNTFKVPGCKTSLLNTCEPTWYQFYNDSQCFEGGADCAAPGTAGETSLYYQNSVLSHSPLPNVINYAVQNYPQFDLTIPDQYRVDVWLQNFAQDEADGTVPQLSIMWISSDHTSGAATSPDSNAMQADNDLAVGRFVDAISHSPIWKSSAIFIEEDDAQNGVDHVDGHRSPGYVISPYVRQGGYVDHTYYTQVNMTRTIEQILGLKPMNQNDLVASPMSTLFIDDPPKTNFQPWSFQPNLIPLTEGIALNAFHKNDSPAVKALRAGWKKLGAEIFAGKAQKPDSEDPDTVNHLTWYDSTGFTRPYPGEDKVRPASDFSHRKAPAASLDQD